MYSAIPPVFITQGTEPHDQDPVHCGPSQHPWRFHRSLILAIQRVERLGDTLHLLSEDTLHDFGQRVSVKSS